MAVFETTNIGIRQISFSSQFFINKPNCCSKSEKSQVLSSGRIHGGRILCVIIVTMKRKYYFNEHYFDQIDTPEKAYILGYLYADGCVPTKGSGIRILLHQQDREILERFRKAFEHPQPLCQYQDRFVIFRVNSIYMRKVVAKWGLVPRKGPLIRFPNFLPFELVSHFVRGYFDGDGCIFEANEGRSIRSKFTYSVSICSNFEFCHGLQKFLKEYLNFEMNIQKTKSPAVVQLRCRGNRKCKVFLDFIYKDDTISLTRKKAKYLRLLETLTSPKKFINRVAVIYEPTHNRHRNWKVFTFINSKRKRCGTFLSKDDAMAHRDKILLEDKMKPIPVFNVFD